MTRAGLKPNRWNGWCEDDVRHMIAVMCDRFGTRRRFARKVGVSEAFLCDVLHGRRPPTGALLDVLGLHKRTIYTGPEEGE